MKRINLRDVPDEVYERLATGAEASHQSLNAFVISQLTEAIRVLDAADHFSSYEPPHGTGITLEDAVTAVREVRDES